jgi:hypothetical protein
VGDARRQVQQVARLGDPLALGREAAQHAQVEAHDRGGVEVLRDLPAAATATLDQEHVVGVRVGTDPAAVDGVADHHVVESPARQEREGVQQLADGGHVLVDALHEQRPVRCGQVVEVFDVERSVLDLPATTAADRGMHEPRLDVALARQAGQQLGTHGIAPAREGAPHQERRLLPVPREEARSGQPAEEFHQLQSWFGTNRVRGGSASCTE